MTGTATIRALLAGSAVSNSLSQADKLYRVTLRQYFAGHFHAAAAAFGQVIALDPDHAPAEDYRRLATKRYPNEVVATKRAARGSNTVPYVLIGVGAFVLLAAGGTALLLRRRHGKRPPEGTEVSEPVSVAAQAAAGEPPQPTLPEERPPAPPESAQPEPVQPEPAQPESAQPESAQPSPPLEAAAATAPAPAGRFCPQCGEPRGPEAQFCSACGLRLERTVSHASPNGARN